MGWETRIYKYNNNMTQTTKSTRQKYNLLNFERILLSLENNRCILARIRVTSKNRMYLNLFYHQDCSLFHSSKNFEVMPEICSKLGNICPSELGNFSFKTLLSWTLQGKCSLTDADFLNRYRFSICTKEEVSKVPVFFFLISLPWRKVG